MKVLQINVRATQGGAGRVAYDLHRRLRLAGVDSHFLYGYGSGIADDPAVADNETVERIGTRPSVLFNYACHSVFGWDLTSGRGRILDKAIAASDIVHIHVPHHYFLRWDYLVGLIERHNKPTVITAHDWWFVTGRCGFVESCSGWRRGCGECGPMRFRDLRSMLDFSATFRRRKIASVERLKKLVGFVCPSLHLASDYKVVYSDVSVEVIPNSVDLEFENALSEIDGDVSERNGFLFFGVGFIFGGKDRQRPSARTCNAPGCAVDPGWKKQSFPAAGTGNLRRSAFPRGNGSPFA